MSGVVQRDAFEEFISMPGVEAHSQMSTSSMKIEGFSRLETSSLNDRLLELRDQSKDLGPGGILDKTDSIEDNKTNTEVLGNAREQFSTFNSKGIWLWENGVNIRTVQMKGKDAQKQAIMSVMYHPNLRIWIAACLDMHFRIYDRNLKFLEEIQHDEFAVTQMEYYATDDIILLAGGCGLSSWKVDRDYGIIEDVEYSGIREFSYRFTKLFNFKGFDEWLPRITLDPTRADCGCAIYGIVDRTILVYSLKEKSIVTKLFQAHDGVITRVVWYSRSQFYITACNQGFIKAWAWRPSEDNSKFLHASMASKSPSYVVRAHTKAITGLDLHPVPGLLISSGLEGTIAVTNLETGQELFKLYLNNRSDIENIFNMKYMKISNGPAVIFSTSTGYLKVWRIVSKTAYYDMAVTDILSISSQNVMCANISKYDPMYILPTGFASNYPLYFGCVSMFSGSALHIVPTMLAYPKIINTNSNNLIANENHEEKGLNDEEIIKLKRERDLMISRGFKVPSEDIVDGALDYCMSLRSQRLFVLSDYGTKIRVYGVNDRSSVFWQHRRMKDLNALKNGK